MSEGRTDSNDFKRIFLQDLPLMDVRAPVEFLQGAFPTSDNRPLLDDSQRQQIGIRYKEAGEEEAIRLGLELATDEIREQRLQSWTEFCRENPDGYLYCFRGGLRSRTTQQWLRDCGVNYPLVIGGYKAMRGFLIEQLEQLGCAFPLVVVAGLTGTGKTQLLTRLPRYLDLEGRANHRGSAFGMDADDFQPSVINWENSLAVDLLKLQQDGFDQPVFVEDEGKRIGRLSVPPALYQAMHEAPRIVLTLPLEQRVQAIVADYIHDNWPDYLGRHGERAEELFSRFVLSNLDRIRKRLGGERYQLVYQSFQNGLDQFFDSGQTEAFADGIRILLEQYYDPMYHYQIKSKAPHILAEGDEQTLLDWAQSYRG